jgi:hypothetical protein
VIVPRKPGTVVAVHPDGRQGIVVHPHNPSSELVYVRIMTTAGVTASCNWLRRACTFRFVPA